MTPSRWAAVGLALCGVAWLAGAVVSWGEPPVWSTGGGLALMVVGLAAGGYALVPTAPVWLRAVVTVATPALGLMVAQIVADAAPSESVALLVGGVAAVGAGATTWARSAARPVTGPPAPVRGRRAAR